MNKPLLIIIGILILALGFAGIQIKQMKKDIENKNIEIGALTVTVDSLQEANKKYKAQLGEALKREKAKEKIIADNQIKHLEISSNNQKLKQKLKELSDAKPIVRNYFYERVPDDVLRLLKPAPYSLRHDDRIRVPTPESDDSDTRASNDGKYQWRLNKPDNGFTERIEAVQRGQEQYAKVC